MTTLVLFNSHIHFNQVNADSELVTPRSSRLFMKHIPATVEETDSEGYMKRKSLEKYFFGIIGHLRDRHGQRLESWTLCSHLAN